MSPVDRVNAVLTQSLTISPLSDALVGIMRQLIATEYRRMIDHSEPTGDLILLHYLFNALNRPIDEIEEYQYLGVSGPNLTCGQCLMCMSLELVRRRKCNRLRIEK